MDRIGSHSTQLKKAVELYRQGMSAKAAADAASFPRSSLYKHLSFSNQLRKGPERYQSREPNDPTESEIWEAAAKIRETWSGEERAKRWVGSSGNERINKMFAVIRRHYAGEAA